MFFDLFLNLIYNKKCLICGCSKTDDLLCKSCLKDVEYLSCFPHRIFKEIPIYSCSIYEKNIKKLIHLLKFSHRKTASKPLAEILFKYFKKIQTDLHNNTRTDTPTDNTPINFTIIYPPSYFLKNAQRGFEPMFLIAKEFSKLTGFEMENKLIKKIKHTKPQYKVKNRQKNIKDSFEINQKLIEKYKDKNLLLLDDITTSGSTLNEILDCLLNSNIKNITCLTISKAIK